MATRSEPKDRFTIWPTALALCFPLILLIDLVPVVVTLVVLMIWACSALLALGIAIFSASAGDWQRTVSMSVLPLVTLVLIANAGTLGPIATEIRCRIHFEAMRRNYLEDVSKLPSSGEPRFAVWDWGPLEPVGLTLLTRGIELHNEVVYDESDEIALPLPDRSSAWKKRIANRHVGSCEVLESLGDHFYLVLVVEPHARSCARHSAWDAGGPVAPQKRAAGAASVQTWSHSAGDRGAHEAMIGLAEAINRGRLHPVQQH